MIAEGQPLPDLTLPDQDGNPVALASLVGAPVVLYFYPKDDTPGCTTEACAFRDADAEYRALGARVVGVSPDDPRSHARFARKHGLPFSLLADTQQELCRAFGVWKEKSMYGKTYMGVERTTILVDGAGVVRKIFPKVKVPGHSDAVLEALRAIV